MTGPASPYCGTGHDASRVSGLRGSRNLPFERGDDIAFGDGPKLLETECLPRLLPLGNWEAVNRVRLPLSFRSLCGEVNNYSGSPFSHLTNLICDKTEIVMEPFCGSRKSFRGREKSSEREKVSE